MPSHWSLARRLRIVLSAFAALVLVLVLFLSLTLRSADHAFGDETGRISPARQAASQLLIAMLDQETGLRGYALTKDPAFLQPFSLGQTHELALAARLTHLIGPDDPARAELVAFANARAAWHQAYSDQPLADIRDKSTTATLTQGKLLFDALRVASNALDIQLLKELKAAQAKVNREREAVEAVIITAVAGVLAALFLLQRALRHNVVVPLKDLGRQVGAVAGGDHAFAIVGTGPPDLQDMAAGVERMRLELVSTLQEVEQQQRDLETRASELARSNADLEQFAYVASHDLQEPLRKVSSFCQLLEQRYSEQLDERGLQYLTFAVDGAKRMQQLINDLLTFSRVGRNSEGFVAVDLAVTIAGAWDALGQRVQENGARLEAPDAIPAVTGDASLLHLLMQNLLGNAVKYRRPDEPPLVRVSTQVEGSLLRVAVTDNGIGIPDEYAEKVFVIFQRLHGRDEYEGTGIGLALCKKVVEFHGGTIGLVPSPLGGAGVSFTLPMAAVVVGPPDA